MPSHIAYFKYDEFSTNTATVSLLWSFLFCIVYQMCYTV